ncbi:DUF6855 family protein [Pseudonocardia endophytica]|uniref:DUF6855 family protein n=1 Tax=Pseudonocardia endophytica TaxID=401976 RepID=UPI00311D9E8D
MTVSRTSCGIRSPTGRPRLHISVTDRARASLPWPVPPGCRRARRWSGRVRRRVRGARAGARPRSVEASGRADDNPVGGWYGTKNGLRGRFGNYVPPVLEALGLVELEHNARNNRVRAVRGS